MGPVVAVVSAGNMGAAIARRLTGHGLEVLTTLEGRSAASRARSAEAGMKAVSTDELVGADFLLSVLPPSAALPFAREMAPRLVDADTKPLFVDCNAVSPATVRDIGSVVTATGARFVDACIIGAPPQPGRDGPRFYASGEGAMPFQGLAEYGLDIRVLDGPVGAASALKMSFAGINKGLAAIAAAMILAATRAGAADALRRELEESWPALATALTRQVPDMLPKAYRWVAEMQEIAEFSGEDTAARHIYLGAAELYDRIARDVANSGAEAAVLSGFFGR
jgi:L-threonate 2-dehydrogenase